MVTSNKLPEKKFVTMAGQNTSAVVPQRTLLGEVNEHITCPLCRGYYIDATTIVECLHSFCRSCIIKHLQVKSYCPVCEMMINSAKPNIKLDKALQDIVYKLVPGLFQKEMERRQTFYASRPGPAASATPEQRGEDTERIIFSPEDVISFSLEYADITDSDSISSKSSDSNEPQPTSGVQRRYLQCPAVVNISHLKKFLSMKFDIDSTQFAIDILYKRVPLPDYYTLMDIAYIYNWKRNEPMRFFYQIIDYIAIRNRIFDINRKGSHFRDRKSSPTSTEDTNMSSPAPNLHDQGSEGSSGADSPMPDDSSIKQSSDTSKKCEKDVLQTKKEGIQENLNPTKNTTAPKKNDDEVEKSQFLISFELTAKNNSSAMKSSPSKPNNENNSALDQPSSKSQILPPKVEDSLKRKNQPPINSPEMKKLKIELEKAKLPTSLVGNSSNLTPITPQNIKSSDMIMKPKEMECTSKNLPPPPINVTSPSILPPKEIKSQHAVTTTVKSITESSTVKRTVPVTQNNTLSSPKRKQANEAQSQAQPLPTPTVQKTVSPLKLQVPKLDTQIQNLKTPDVHKPVKKMPDLKPSSLASQTTTLNKVQHVNKVRMDLLANNSDPTIDRSKILSQVKTSLSCQNTLQGSGDPLKSIFDSCNINIPSSLSITLTDQKLDPRNPNEANNIDQKKNIVNKNLAGVSSTPGHKVPSPPVHNYIEILKLPDTDPKKSNKPENILDMKISIPNKSDGTANQSKVPNKSSEVSAKGPIPNLKPIADTKIGKQTGNFSAPITFQQTFEQQLQSLSSEKKPKLPKTKTQVPKLVPAPKAFNVVNKSTAINKPNTPHTSAEPKSSSALDLSTPHNIPSQVVPQQTFDKALETMQSIANLAKKQNLPSKGLPLTSMAQSNVFSSMPSRPLTSGVSSIRVPSANSINQIKHDKPNTLISSLRQEVKNNPVKPANTSSSSLSSPSYQIGSHNSPTTAQPSPRSQTRSPSSSPKLVIAEEKQASNSGEQSGQVISMMNSQIPLMSMSKNESPKPSPGPSKSGLKPVKPLTPSGKATGIRPPITLNPTIMNASPDYLTRPQAMSAHHALMRHQMDAWIKVQRQFDLMKSMSNLAHQTHNDFNNKDK